MTPAVRHIALDRFGPVLSADFSGGAIPSFMAFSRASGATSGTYLDASGSSYTTYTTDQPRFMAGGVKIEPAATNRLLNSTAPVTQTTASLATGTYCLWVTGSGSATSSAGTATGSGFGVATAGVPNVITLTGAGTVTVTVAGSLDRFQLELSTAPTTFIVTAGAVATRAAEQLYCTTTLISANSGALMVDFTSDISNAGRVLLGFSTSSFSDTAYIDGATGQLVTRVAGSPIGPANAIPSEVGRNKHAISYMDSVAAAAGNGVGEGVALSAAAPYTGWTGRFSLGCAPWNLGNQIVGTVHRFRFYNRWLPAEFLKAITR